MGEYVRSGLCSVGAKQGDRRQICPLPDALIDGNTSRNVISVRIEAGGFAGEVYGAMTNHIWR